MARSDDATDDATGVAATVRITPASLLLTSAIGTAAVAAAVVPVAWTLSGAAAPGWWGAGSASGLAALFAAVFAVGYRRHGRPVPTRARTEGGRLWVQVPAAWGKLIRDEVCLTVGSVDETDAGVTVTGRAQEWWDPGTYEVQASPEAADRMNADSLSADLQAVGEGGRTQASARS